MSGYISYRNLADSATITAPDQTVVAPLANMQTRQLALTSVVDVGSVLNPVDIRLDRGVAAPTVPPGICALLGLNIGNYVSVQMIVQTGPDGSSWTTIGSTGSTFSDEGVPGLPDALICAFSGTVERYVRIHGYWTSPEEDDIRSIGRLWFGPAIVLPEGVNPSWELGVEDTGSLDQSAGAQWYESVRTRTRFLRMGRSQIQADVAFGYSEADLSASDVPSFQGLQMEAGSTGEVIVLPKSPTGLWIRRLGIYGHLDRPPTIRHDAGPNYSTELTVIEER